MGYAPSIQQQAVYNHVRTSMQSLIIQAVAGAGKTTTLVEVCKLIAAMDRRSAVFTAFNKAIADEIAARLKEAGIEWNQVRAATFHSLGRSAWVKVHPKAKTNEFKVQAIMEQMQVPEGFRGFVGKAVSHAKSRALGVEGSIEDQSQWFAIVDHHDMAEMLEDMDAAADPITTGIAHAIAVLKRSIALNPTEIDFDDMLYAPVLHQVRMWQNDYVLVDEAQDTNPVRRAFARKMLKPGGMLIAVGDKHQAIYGFTGADNDALDQIAREFNAIELPLTVTYRCPKAVVDVARRYVSHITAADSAPAGTAATIEFDQFVKLGYTDFTTQDAVLCRNTKPLVELAFNLIRRRIPCHVEGREIGTGLLKLAARWKSVETVADLRVKLEDHLKAQQERLLAKKQEAKLAVLFDQVTTLFVIMESLTDDAPVSEVKRVIDEIFTDGGAGVTLSTIHKSKGREWKKVYWLGRNRWQPSPFARQDWQHEQEVNLMYVAATRAKDTLVEVTVPIPAKRAA